MPTCLRARLPGQDGNSSRGAFGRAGTVDQAGSVAEVMKEYDCCLMESHGAIAAMGANGRGILELQVRGGNREMYYIPPGHWKRAEPMPCRWRNRRRGLIQKKSFFRVI